MWTAYKRINGTLPDYLNVSLRKKTPMLTQESREIEVYIYGSPFRRDISEGGRPFAVRTVKDWNNLPLSLKIKLNNGNSAKFSDDKGIV